MQRLYIDASVIVEDSLYFMTCNNNGLFKMNLYTNVIELITEIPTFSKNMRKFSSLIHFERELWMIPRGEKYLYIYNLETALITRLSIPAFEKTKMGMPAFRRAIVIDCIMWLAVNYSDFILKINMRDKRFELIHCENAEINMSKEKINFQNISFDSGKIYCFKNSCSHNMVFDPQNNSFHKLPIETNKHFGVIADNKVIISPKEYNDQIIVFDLNSLKEINKISVDDAYKEKPEYFMYWYMERFGNNIFFLPHEAKAMIIYDIKNNKIRYVSLINPEYKSLSKCNMVALSEMHQWNSRIIATSYLGNQIFVFDIDGNYQKYITLNLPVKDNGMTLKGFINEVVSCDESDWKQLANQKADYSELIQNE